jgi:hypothetical protein
MRRAAIASVFWLGVGCSAGASAPAGGSPGLGDGDHLTASLEIPAGMTVTIAPGARIVAAPGVVLTVSGTLVVASATSHARIATAAPQPDATAAWGGIVVASGGRLDADGLDLGGATTALKIAAGSAGARYDDGTITDASVPFQIEAGARLDTTHAAVVNAGSTSGIAGDFHASYLDYETHGVAGGLITNDPSAIFDATDSTFHGMFLGGGDYITSYASSRVHVAYSTITESHCAFHFDDVASFEIDHVTAGAATPTGAGGKDVYGAMLYGSGAGPNVISNSNFMGSEHDLDQENANGPLTITNTYTTGLDGVLPTTTWSPADVAQAPIVDAHPR